MVGIEEYKQTHLNTENMSKLNMISIFRRGIGQWEKVNKLTQMQKTSGEEGRMR